MTKYQNQIKLCCRLAKSQFLTGLLQYLANKMSLLVQKIALVVGPSGLFCGFPYEVNKSITQSIQAELRSSVFCNMKSDMVGKMPQNILFLQCFFQLVRQSLTHSPTIFCFPYIFQMNVNRPYFIEYNMILYPNVFLMHVI